MLRVGTRFLLQKKGLLLLLGEFPSQQGRGDEAPRRDK